MPDPDSLFFFGVLLVWTSGLLALAWIGIVAHGCIATAAFGIGLLHLALLGRIAGVAGFHGSCSEWMCPIDTRPACMPQRKDRETTAWMRR